MSGTGDTITVTGNVATDPELKRTPAGVAIATFRVASGLRRFDRDAGAWSDAGTNWYTVSVFRALAEHALASLSKGDRVILTGRLRLRDWDNGTRRGTAVEIDADAIGHDLRWGTTTFAKDSSSVQAAPAESEWPQPVAGDAWAAPGVVSAESGNTTTASGEAPALVLVAAAGDAAAADDQTPF